MDRGVVMKKIVMVLTWISLSSTLLARGGGDAFAGGAVGGILGGVMGSAITSGGKSESGHGVVRELDKLEGNVRSEFERVYRAIDNLTRDIKDVKENRPAADHDFEDLKNSIKSFKSDVRNIKTSISSLENRLDKIEDDIAAVKASQEAVSVAASSKRQKVKSKISPKNRRKIPVIDSSDEVVIEAQKKIENNESASDIVTNEKSGVSTVKDELTD